MRAPTIRRFVLGPFEDFGRAFQHTIPEPPWVALGILLLGCAVSWWIYVPIHELLHAFGCLGTGGTVTRLEIDAIYGAAALKRVFPFVEVGSRYAGQLTGFDTHGSDLVYLATDIAPFLLTIFLGVPLLRRLTRVERAGPGPAFVFGLALPVALAPFTNLVGDYYEMGSIVVSRSVRLVVPDLPLDRWRSDDLIKLTGDLFSEGTFRALDVFGLALGAAVGLALAFATYAMGSRLASIGARR